MPILIKSTSTELIFAEIRGIVEKRPVKLRFISLLIHHAQVKTSLCHFIVISRVVEYTSHSKAYG